MRTLEWQRRSGGVLVRIEVPNGNGKQRDKDLTTAALWCRQLAERIEAYAAESRGGSE